MKQDFFALSPELEALSGKALEKCAPAFAKIEKITEYNQQKVLQAFIANKVSERHLLGSTGYGYNDEGRKKLDAVFAQAMGAEDALIRHSFASGTHTLMVALFGLLRPKDVMLSVTGTPYDTIQGAIGISGSGGGTLLDFGIEYRQVDLTQAGLVDYEAISTAMSKEIKLVYIQRSRGYTLRPSLSVEEIEKIAERVKQINPKAIVMVDNCYGEFVQRDEPCARGADIIAGSLIKNPGGGIAPSGGYIAGKAELVELCANRMTTAATGREVGCTLGHSRELYLGLFNAPHAVGEALKTAAFTAALFAELGYKVTPAPLEERADIIQAVLLEDAECLKAYCRGIQSGSPVDSFVTPEPWDMPGYDSQVIMAAGTFTLGSSIELSADAPLRPPFAVWQQGGVNFHAAKAGVLMAAQGVIARG
ncbi:MAG: methionine gamma-lyase family protein [Oscillospiraceae bacterium]|jgi:cystathionine beta-lyase family protein involved in aluminum resistance|nr:methionine gamma-lyase family protein [Oscillospiraceae bacterium]